MGLTTIAPVAAYTSDTSEPTPDNYSQFSEQERVSVNLIDSDLWLVDNSQLNGQTIDEPVVSLVSLLDWTTKDQTNVSLDNITAVSSSIGIPTTGTSGESNLLPSLDRSGEALLQLSEVTGSLQIDSATTPSGSGGSSSFSSGEISTTSTSDSSFSGDGGGTSSSIGTPFSASTSGTPDSPTATPTEEFPPSSTTSTSVSTPSETVPGTSSTPTSTTTSISTSTSTPTSTSTSTSISTPSLAPPSTEPVPVPFDVSSTLGLAIVLGIFGSRKLIQRYSSERWFHRFQRLG